MTQIKGIKVNGTSYNLNLSNIGSHLNSPEGKDYTITVDEKGNVYGANTARTSYGGVTAETIENGTKIATISVDGTSTEIYAPTAQSGTGTVGELTSNDGKVYILCVKEDGTLFTKEKIEEASKESAPTSATKDIFVPKLFINSIYCGGDNADETSINYCSHNFVELANCTNNDINLEGMSLQYVGSENGNDWKVLPLSGTIKAGSTFVIRGAQCSSDITKINVENYDLEWKVGEELIKFNNTKCKFYLVFSTEKSDITDPYTAVTSTDGTIGYIELAGFGTGVASEGGKPFTNVKPNYLYRKYYSLDPGAKAIKALKKRSNSGDWLYIDLTKENGEAVRSNEIYTPRASWEGKTLFYDKTDVDYIKPSMITCSFGIQATDNGDGATRCFNWITCKIDESYIWISTDKSNWGTAHKAFEEGDGRTSWTNSIYNRKAQSYSNNTTFIVNKFIISGLTSGTYYYIAGKKNTDGTPCTEYCTDIHSFTVVSDSEVADGFSFVQTTDQQGFIWDEYEVWKATAKLIEKEDTSNAIKFMVNTGDMTQDGNRIYEWLDYFNGKGDYFNNMEEMTTIGNNDLSLRDLTAVSNGDDADKLWLENINFFYTFEIDDDNLPIFDVTYTPDGATEEVTESYFIPSLYSFNYGNAHFMCVNSEIKAIVEDTEFDSYNRYAGYGFGDNNYGNFYPKIKTWCENDIAKNSKTWNIVYMHEMPFTIMTSATTIDRSNNVSVNRGGASINTNLKNDYEKYWFSEFCQTHNIKLVLGGHKHTQATSWPLLENVTGTGTERIVNDMMPIIVVATTDLAEFNNSTALKEYTGTTIAVCTGKKYPDGWFDGEEIASSYATLAKLCEFKLKSDISNDVTPVIYAMSQSSGYKHTSNKELPSADIPWLHYYYPEDESHAVNNAQRLPMYTIWTIGSDKIEGSVRGAYGIFNDDGKFNVQSQGAKVRNGKATATASQTVYNDSGAPITTSDIKSINALSATIATTSALTSTTKIVIE